MTQATAGARAEGYCRSARALPALFGAARPLWRADIEKDEPSMVLPTNQSDSAPWKLIEQFVIR